MKKGDHIVVARRGYAHHGVYVGKKRVIHYNGWWKNKFSASIEETSLRKFEGSDDAHVVTHIWEPFSRSEIVERAWSRIDESDYDVVRNNCEHFANWCVEGVHRSEQVQRVLVDEWTSQLGGYMTGKDPGEGRTTLPSVLDIPEVAFVLVKKWLG